MDLLDRLQDIEAFNQWRTSNPDEPVDLEGQDLQGLNLRGANLAGANLKESNLTDTMLYSAILSGANLEGALLERADIREAQFGHVELFDSSLIDTELGRAFLHPANLTGASLEAARAEGANFKECNFHEVNLTECDLRQANLKRTDFHDGFEGELPPESGDIEGLINKFGDETHQVRQDAMLFAIVLYQVGEPSSESLALLNALASRFEFTPQEIEALLPRGQVQLEDFIVQPPNSSWLRRTYFSLMCALASTMPPTVSLQLQVLGHFGSQWGYSDMAMRRIMEENLGIEILPA